MKRFVTAALAAATLVFAGASASANTYLSIEGGGTFDPNLSAFCSGCSVGMNTGYNAGVGLGTSLDSWLGSQWEVRGDAFLTNSAYSPTICISDPYIPCSHARLDSLSLMASLVYNFDLGSAFTPYLGFGVGGVDVIVDSHYIGEASNWRFGLQALAGASFAVNDEVSLFAEYRFQDAGTGTVCQALNGCIAHVEYMSNNVSAGIRINL